MIKFLNIDEIWLNSSFAIESCFQHRSGQSPWVAAAAVQYSVADTSWAFLERFACPVIRVRNDVRHKIYTRKYLVGLHFAISVSKANNRISMGNVVCVFMLSYFE